MRKKLQGHERHGELKEAKKGISRGNCLVGGSRDKRQSWTQGAGSKGALWSISRNPHSLNILSGAETGSEGHFR